MIVLEMCNTNSEQEQHCDVVQSWATEPTDGRTLSMTIELRSIRCVLQPPTMTPYFSMKPKLQGMEKRMSMPIRVSKQKEKLQGL